MGAKAFGEQSPTQGEDAVSWQTWSNGFGTVPNVSGDPDWGKLSLELSGAEGRSAVYDMGSAVTRTFTLEENRYGTGAEDATLQIRGSTTIFEQDDIEPTWETYSTSVSRNWRYVQVREITSDIYYADATGGDNADDGLSEATAWKTIAKINVSTFLPGNYILFKRGELWREELTIPSAGLSGKPVIFSSYGTGDKPKIYGSDVPTSWTQEIVTSTITRVQAAKGSQENDASVTISWNTTPTQGNLLIAVGRGTTTIGNASISGWTLASSALITTGASTVGIWYKVAGASEGNVTLDWTGSTTTGFAIMEWSAGATILDQISKTDDTGGTVTSRSSGTTPTTTVDDELVIAGVGTGASTTAQSWSNSFVDEYSPDTVTFYIGSLVVSSTGTYETTMSWTTARRAGGCIATFNGTGASDITLYYTAQSADPLYVGFIGTDTVIHVGNKVASKSLLLGEYDWWFDDPNNRLYVCAATDPATRYASVEVGNTSRDRGIMWLEDNHDHTVINGFDIAFIVGNGIVQRSYAHITNNLVHYIGEMADGHSFAIEINAGSNSKMDINTVHNVEKYGFFLVSSYDPYICDNNIIESNIVYDCKEALVAVYCEATTLSMSENIVRFNYLYHTTGFSLGSGSGYGILSFGLATADVDLLDIFYNIISVKKAGIILQSYVTNAELYNNTIHSTTARGIYIQTTGAAGIKLKNNIVYVEGDLPCLSVVDADSVSECDYNCYWNPAADPIMWHWDGTDYTKSQFATYQAASGMDANSIVADPLFVDFANRDFHLQSTSPCRNIGVDVGLTQDYAGTVVPQGTDPDIGAYEYIA